MDEGGGIALEVDIGEAIAAVVGVGVLAVGGCGWISGYHVAVEERVHLFDLDLAGLYSLVEGWGLRRFRADQVIRWVYERGVDRWDQMTDLSKADRRVLSERMKITDGRVLGHDVAEDGVQKLLLGMGGGESEGEAGGLRAECVMIPSWTGPAKFAGTDRAGVRRTACVSSQSGCPVGCRFCASGIGGLDGNLTAGQIVEQVWRLGRLRGSGRVTNVVLMGMGEPLANFEAVSAAVRRVTEPWGLGISARRVTVSTVGLPAQMRRLADLGLPVTLAISLHAPNDELRRELIPWAEHVTIEQLVKAGRYYYRRTRREVTIEYILLGGVNDRPEHATELARVASSLRSNVNLIRYNEVAGLGYSRPRSDDAYRFQAILRRGGVNAHVRASRGRDIDAACGQLRHEGKKAGVEAAPTVVTVAANQANPLTTRPGV